MPRSGWIAVGAAAMALLGPAVGPLPTLLAGLAAGLLAAAATAAGPDRWRVVAVPRLLAVAAGVLLVAVRLWLGGLAPPPSPAIPVGEGPWPARVAAVSAPREGRQVATLALESAGGPRIAAELPPYPTVVPHDRVLVGGRLRPLPDGDVGAWYRRIGVVAMLRAAVVEPLPPSADAAGVLESVRRGSGRALATALPEPEAGLAAGILVGLRDEVDRRVAAAFTTAGVSHVVAISGWNIAIVAAAAASMLRRTSRRRRSVAIVLAIVAYTAFAGASPSVVRAAAMAAVVLVARESGRPGRAAAALGAGVAILLVADPGLVADAGFQLSVLATAGLLAWATPLRDALDRRLGGRLPGWLVETLALSLAAQLATLPVVLAAFGRLSLIAPVANLAVAPLVPPTMALGAVALGGGWLAELGAPAAIGTLLGLPAWAFLRLLIAVVDVSAAIPFASVEVTPPWDVVLASLAAIVALGLTPAVRPRLGSALGESRRRGPTRVPASREPALPDAPAIRPTGHGPPRRPSRASRVAAVLLAASVAAVGLAAVHRPDGRVRVTVLDVGQGDAILVEGERGGRLLVDGGPDPQRLLVALDAQLPPWDRRLDLVVLTHPHEDHVAGLPAVLDRYRVGRVFEPGMRGPGPSYAAWTERLATLGLPSGRLRTGDRFALDGIRFSVLWPDRGAVPEAPPDEGRAVNRASIVLLGIVGSGRFLLTGDAEDDVDEALVERGLPRVDVLKVAHHGSRTATSEQLLGALRPAIAIVSTGEGNTYGHPAPPTLERIAAGGTRLFRTDRDGTVSAAFDGTAWSVTTERRPADDATTAPAEAPAATPDVPGPAALGYHRTDDHPRSALRRGGPPLARSAGLAPPPLAGGRGDRVLARGPGRGGRDRRRPPARRGRSAPPRRRQAAAGGTSRRGPPPRSGVGRLARGPGLAGARPGGRAPPRHRPRRRRDRRLAARRGADRGAPSRLCRQAGRPAARADGPAVRVVGPALPRRLGPDDPGRRPRPGRRARDRRLRRPPDPAGRRPPAGVDLGVLARQDADGHRADPAGRVAMTTGTAIGYFWGDDGYGLERAADRLAERLATTTGVPPERRRTTGTEVTLGRLEEWVATAPLFGGGTLVTVSEPGPLLRSAADRAALEAVIAHVAPGNGIVFLDPLDGSGPGRRAGSEALKAAVAKAGGETAELRAPTEGRLATWIEARAAERGVHLGRGAAQELGTRVGGFVREGDVDRRRMGIVAVAELEKLALYRAGAEVTVEDVRTLVPEAIPASSWAFLDAIAERRTAAAADLLPRILETMPEPVIVALLHRRLRELIEVADHLAAGEKPAALVRILGQKPFRVEKLVEQARRWTLPELEAALEGVLELDERIKGLEPATEAQRRLGFTLWLAGRAAPRERG
jgi:competence protein ComEC